MMKYERSSCPDGDGGPGHLILADEAGAMPVFARKYRTSCMTCHEAFPRRNAVGEAFRLNGFRFEDDEIYCKEPPVEMGDEAYKRAVARFRLALGHSPDRSPFLQFAVP